MIARLRNASPLEQRAMALVEWEAKKPAALADR
jgi:hypothetical protein